MLTPARGGRVKFKLVEKGIFEGSDRIRRKFGKKWDECRDKKGEIDVNRGLWQIFSKAEIMLSFWS